MPRKEYKLSEQTINIIHEVMEETGLKYEVDAVTFMINDYKRRSETRDEIADILSSRIKEELQNDITRLRLGVRTAERNSIILKDLANTLLYKTDCAYLMPAYGREKHKVLIEAEEHLDDIISNAKQIKDNEKAGKGQE